MIPRKRSWLVPAIAGLIAGVALAIVILLAVTP